MRIILYNVQCTMMLICVTKYLVKADEDVYIPNRQSEIDKFVQDKSNPLYTTRDYDNSIEPLSVDNDGAPACAPVVYGDQSDFNEDGKVTQDEVVRKLREEFFKKHEKGLPAPADTKNEGAVFPDKRRNDYDVGNRERNIKTDAERKLREEFLKKHKYEMNPPEQIKREAQNNDNTFREEAVERLNEIDLQKKNNLLKQYSSADNAQGNFKEEIIKQHWNKFSSEKINNKEKKITLIPGEIDNSEPGYKHDQLQRDIHEEIYGDTDGMEGKNKFKIMSKQKDVKKLEAQIEDQKHVHKTVNRIHNQLKKLINFGEKIENKENFMHYKKLMNIELRETTNEHQHDRVYGPSSGLKKLSKANKKKKHESINNPIKHKRRKRNVHSTKNPHVRSTKQHKSKTTKYYMDVDGRFRDIDEVEEERNRFSSELERRPTPVWLNYDGYVAPKTEKKFRPRPTLNYNRVPKEPLDYGSYDKSAHWRMMTELILNATLPPKFYESLSEPELPDTKEAFDVCRENFTTSECFRYPDISRLRDTRERKFMKKYYHKDYPDMVDDDDV